MAISNRLRVFKAAGGLTMPSVHINGTAQRDLLEDLLTAMNAMDDALTALQKTSPNGRDYYPQGGDALRQATREFNARKQKLLDVKQELEQIAEHVHAQPDNNR